MKRFFDYKYALCEEAKMIHIHHIDGDFRNNDKKKLIPLCQRHHYLSERLKCIVCGRKLSEIVKAIVINNKDISELGDHYAYTCKNHLDTTLRVYHKRKLIISSLFEKVKGKLNS